MTTWTLNKLTELIDNRIEESLHLDYKAGKAIENSKEIPKDVSAFANSDGGTIIYGIKEFNDRALSHLPEALDPIAEIKKYSKERLEQIINSTIQPRIKGVVITPVHVNSEKAGVIYIVDIPKGNTAYQYDYRYYKRFNFESVQMHDYEVKDVILRNVSPKIDIILNTESVFSNDPAERDKFNISVHAVNSGGVLAKYLKIYLFVTETFVDASRLFTRSTRSIGHTSWGIFEFDNIKRPDLTQLMNPRFQQYSVYYEPILPGMAVELGKFPCINLTTLTNVEVKAIIHVDNNQPTECRFNLVNADFVKIK